MTSGQGVLDEPGEPLDVAIDRLGDKVVGLTTALSRQRLVIRAVAVIVAVVMALAVIVAWQSNRTSNAQDDADTAVEQLASVTARVEAAQGRQDDLIGRLATVTEAARIACEQSNESATKQHQLWEGIIALPSTQPSNPENLARFRALLDDTFPQRNCGAP